MKVLSPERMARYDAYAINSWGIPSAVLMENAGRNTYRLMKEQYLEEGMGITLFCGRGNNGGDGFVIARYALRDGFPVTLFLLCNALDLKGDAALNMNLYKAMGGEIIEIDGVTEEVTGALQAGHVVVDAIFGTGLSKMVEGRERAVIEEINRSQKIIIAVDMPSGIDGRNGMPMGVAVKATHTFTYGYPKLGQVFYPGAHHTGALTVIDISIPVMAEAQIGIDGHIIDGAMVRSFFRERMPWDHKGTYGHVAVIAGSPGKTGAACMASLAALKIGAGLVTLLIPRSLNSIAAGKLTEVMTHPVEDHGTGYFIAAAYDEIVDFVKDKDVIIMGPGLSQHEETGELVGRIYSELDKPFVIDADGLNAFQGRTHLLRKVDGDAVVTPHPGEMGRLTGLTPKEINMERMATGQGFVEEYGVNLVLKGARTVVFDCDGQAFICPTGNPALAKGGSGDILTGFIGGLRSQGYSTLEAAIFGAYLHGYIADRWVMETTSMDLLAGDILTGLGRALREIRDGEDKVYIEERL